ncbi:MAG TPA: hypothetical protein VM165_20225 [Planctomycetaceae bacterium]|nr:hypothetical protein [Planctomycetaceae bacterium]
MASHERLIRSWHPRLESCCDPSASIEANIDNWGRQLLFGLVLFPFALVSLVVCALLFFLFPLAFGVGVSVLGDNRLPRNNGMSPGDEAIRRETG